MVDGNIQGRPDVNNILPRTPGFIYIMKASSGFATLEQDVYKIGFSIHPEQRLAELQRGVAGFLSIEMIYNAPVSSMLDVEQKIHGLFEEEHIFGEWFALKEHHILAVKSFVGQISTLVRSAKRKRRFGADIIFGVPNSVLNGDGDSKEPVRSELESMILTYIQGPRKQLNQKLKDVLKTQVTAGGKTYPSPEELWASGDASFRVWVERKLVNISALPGMNVQRAVYSIAKYDGVYGWIDNPKNPTKQNDIPTVDIGYGEY